MGEICDHDREVPSTSMLSSAVQPALSLDLFSTLKLGDLTLPNRILMAPMTRGRATPDHVPTAMMGTYYEQRADAGLLITEAVGISRKGLGWLQAPGIWNDQQVAGWRHVTERVHKAGGRIFAQLWHMGRVSHPDFLDGELPLAPSPVAAEGHCYTPLGKRDYVEPREMTLEDIAETIRDYGAAARRAIDAGFEGIEVHAASGYLPDQFLRDGTNRRRDKYGGSVDNRVRFLLEVVESLCNAAGSRRVGVRLSPRNWYNDMSDSDPATLFGRAAEALNQFDLAYLAVFEVLPHHFLYRPGEPILPTMRKAYRGTVIPTGGYDKQSATHAISTGVADAITFGVPYIGNPDLVTRYATDAPLNDVDPETFYVGGEAGYIDYPSLSDGRDNVWRKATPSDAAKAVGVR